MRMDLFSISIYKYYATVSWYKESGGLNKRKLGPKRIALDFFKLSLILEKLN
jgi:hypothetical protein